MFPISLRLLLVVLVLIAGAFDIYVRRIPNWLTVSAAAAGLSINIIVFAGVGAAAALEGAGIALLLYIPLYLLRGMGAGDVKLMAAVGAIVGPANWFAIFLATSLLGGVASLAIVVAQGRFYQTWFNMQSLIGSLMRLRAPYEENNELDVRDSRSSRLPHGAVIACGATLCLMLDALS